MECVTISFMIPASDSSNEVLLNGLDWDQIDEQLARLSPRRVVLEATRPIPGVEALEKGIDLRLVLARSQGVEVQCQFTE